MQIPAWLSAFTHAGNGMTPSNLDSFVSGAGYQPTVGDAARSIGHDMMEHFRAGQQPGNALAAPVAAGAPGMTPAPAFMPVASPPPPPMTVQTPSFSNQPMTPPTDLASILAQIGHGVVPHLPVGVPLSKVAIHFAPPSTGPQ